jgi:hypothetical protein
MKNKTDHEKHETPLRKTLAERAPHRKTIDASDLAGVEKQSIVLQVLRNAEQNEALALAYTMRDRASKNVPALRDDEEFFNDLKIVAHLFLSCRDSAEPDAYPAFVSPEWMQEKIHKAELETLLAHYNAFVAKVFPGGADTLTEPEKVVALLRMLAEHASTDIPNEVLARWAHVMLVELVVRAAVLLKDAEDENAVMRTRLEGLAVAGVVYPEDGVEADVGALSNFAIRLMAAEPGNDLLHVSAERVRTARDAEIVMSMLGWKEGSQAWRRVLGEEHGEKTI